MMSDSQTPPPPPTQPPLPPPQSPPEPIPAPGSAREMMTRGIGLSEEQRLVLAVFAGAGLVLCIAEFFIADDWLPGLFGMFLIVYAAIVVAGSLPAHWISARLDDVLDRWVRDRTGSGFYGMVALGHFAHAELHDVIGGLSSGWGLIQGSVVQYLIGFSLESLANMISAFLWPFRMFSAEGAIPTLVFGLACWAVFQVGRNFLPVPDLSKPEKPEDPMAPKTKRKRRWF